jgi:hypothetical protein
MLVFKACSISIFESSNKYIPIPDDSDGETGSFLEQDNKGCSTSSIFSHQRQIFFPKIDLGMM